MTSLTLLCLAVTLGFGAISQRVCGMGMGLVAVPFFVLATGPVLGVFTVNLAATVTGLAVCYSLRNDILWDRWRTIAWWSIVGTLPGVLIVAWLPSALLQIVIGSFLVLALITSVWLVRYRFPIPRQALGATGFVGGLLNCTVGQAAPAMVLYPRDTRWDQRTFQATLQPSFLVMNIASLVAKGVGVDLPPIPMGALVFFATVTGATCLGIVAGEILARHVSSELARKFAFTVALAGAAATLFRGILAAMQG